MSDFGITLHNIHFKLKGSVSGKTYIFSVASVNSNNEVALFDDDGFIPVHEWFAGCQAQGDVLPIYSLEYFTLACSEATNFAKNN